MAALFGMAESDNASAAAAAARFRSELAAAGTDAPAPALTLDIAARGAGAANGDLAGGAAPTLAGQVPVDAALSFRLPLLDPARSARAAGAAAQSELASAAFRAARDQRWRDFLFEATQLAQATELAAIRTETARSFDELRTIADKRLKAGAGTARDALRALVAAQTARLALDQLRLGARAPASSWGDAATAWLAEPVNLALLADPSTWAALFMDAKRPAPGIFDSAAELPAAPDASDFRPPVDPGLARIAGERRLEAEAAGTAPRLDLLADLSAAARPDTSGAAAWDASLRAGIGLAWPLLGSANQPETAARRAADSEELKAVEAAALQAAAREAAAAARAYGQAIAALAVHRQTRASVEQYAAALRVEQASGAVAVDSVIVGWQLVFDVRERETAARWDAVRAGIAWLGAAGLLHAPEATAP